MRIVKTEEGWFYKQLFHKKTRFGEYLQEVVNRSLSNRIYGIGTSSEEIGSFTVFSLVESEDRRGGILNHFTLEIFEDDRLAAPLIVLYAIKNHPLAEKVVGIIGDYHPRNLIIVSKKRDIMPFMLEEIINSLK